MSIFANQRPSIVQHTRESRLRPHRNSSDRGVREGLFDDLMPGLPTGRAATAPDALAHATVPTSAQAEPNVQQQPQSQPDPSTKQQQESPASAIMNALIAEHETKHHVSTACSSLAVLGHAIAL